jgi:predicted nucleic acid-binding protein
LWKDRKGRISSQVLQELYSKGTQKWPALRVEIHTEILELMDWHPVPIDAGVLEGSWKIQDRFKLSFCDALIVAAAKAASCKYLLTEDLQADQELDGVLVVNPFRTCCGRLRRGEGGCLETLRRCREIWF